MTDTNLSQKFAGLQTQLATQHAEIIQLLGWLRQDVADIKSDVDNIRISAANTQVFAQQTASNTLDVYNRLATLNSLYEYLTRNASSGEDLLSRLNDLQYRTGLIQTYTDGLEGLLTPMGQTLTDTLAQVTSIRVSTAPTPASSLYTRINAMNGWLYVMYQAMTGQVASWTGKTVMEYLEELKDSAQSIQSSNNSIDGQLVNVIDGIDAIRECACETPEPDVCDTGTPLDVEARPNDELRWFHAASDEVEIIGPPLVVPSWLPALAADGFGTESMGWIGSTPAVIDLGDASFCVRNGSAAASVIVRMLEVDETGSPTMTRFTIAPGVTQHFPSIGAAHMFLALALDDVPTDIDQIKIIVFAVG